MTAKEFFMLVVQMRNAQIRYFRTRDKSDLQASKQLEKQVDDEIRRVERAQIEPELPLLFY
jgi:phosphate uptake regulator